MFRGFDAVQLRTIVLMLVVFAGGLFFSRLGSPPSGAVSAGTAGIVEGSLDFEPVPVAESSATKLPDGLIDLNSATAEELELLPGVGATKSRTIIDNRSAYGPFRSVGDLERVPGFGEATVNRLRPYLSAEAASATAPAAFTDRGRSSIASGFVAQEPITRASLVTPTATPLQVIRINVAGVEELELLKGVGPVMAERILRNRLTYGPFRSFSDLERVKGIGPKTVEKNRELISFN